MICPECQQAGITVTFKDKRGQGSHRWAKHRVRGVSASTLAYHQQRDQAAKANKPVRHYNKKTALVPASIEVAGTLAKPVEISVAIRGYAMGRLEALAEQIARENNLPEKEFVKQVAANLAALTQQ